MINIRYRELRQAPGLTMMDARQDVSMRAESQLPLLARSSATYDVTWPRAARLLTEGSMRKRICTRRRSTSGRIGDSAADPSPHPGTACSSNVTFPMTGLLQRRAQTDFDTFPLHRIIISFVNVIDVLRIWRRIDCRLVELTYLCSCSCASNGRRGWLPWVRITATPSQPRTYASTLMTLSARSQSCWPTSARASSLGSLSKS